MNLNFYEQSSSVGFCNENSSLASLFKSSICYLLGNEIDALFMVGMGLEYLGLILFIFLSLFSLGVLLIVCLGWFFVTEFLGGCFWVVWVLVVFLFLVRFF